MTPSSTTPLDVMAPDSHETSRLSDENDDDYKRAEAIALSASHILSSQKARSKSPLLITRKLIRPTPTVEILTDPEQRRLVEKSLHLHEPISDSSGGGISLADTTKKEFQRLSVNVNKTVEKFIDIIQNSTMTQPILEVTETASSESLDTQRESSDAVNQEPVKPPSLTSFVYKRRSGLGILSSKAWERRKLVLIGNKLFYFHIDDTVDDLKPTSMAGESIEDLKPSSSMIQGDDLVISSSSSTTTTQVGKRNKDLRQLWEQATQMTQTFLQQAEPAFSSMSFTHFDKSNDPTIPRGCIDLWKDQAMVAISFATPPWNGGIGNNSTTNSTLESLSSSTSTPPFTLSAAHVAPTPFCLTILVKSESKWKLCFDSQDEQRLWLQTLSHIILKGSVKYYNDGLIAVGGPLEGFHSPSSVKDSLWEVVEERTTPYNNIEPLLSSIDVSNTNVKDIDKKKEYEDSISIEYRTPPFLVPLANLVLVFIYFTSLSWISFAALLFALNSYIFPTRPLQQLSSLWEGSKESRKDKGHDEQQEKPESTQVSVPKEIDWTFKPPAGSSMTKISSSSNTTDGNHCSWCALPSNHVKVRSFGYILSKKKIPAPYALYEPIQMDLFKSSKRIAEIASKVTLPQLPENSGNNPWKSPDWFVVSLAVPSEIPKLTRPTNDGDGFIATIYYSMKAETKEILKHITSDSFIPEEHEQEVDLQRRRYNGVRLFEEWCSRAPKDSQMQGRFKFFPNVDNLDEIGIPSWISTWVGKPTLIKRTGITGFLHSLDIDQARVMEFDISFHPFPYLAKSAAASLLKNSVLCKKILANCSFAIEGRCDDELPEVLIGDPVQIRNINTMLITEAEDFFSVKKT